MVDKTFNFASLIPSSNILIHGDKQCGKSMLLKNIFPYIGGKHHASNSHKTIPKVLFVASSGKTVEEYKMLTPNIVTGPKGNIIVTRDLGVVVTHAIAHEVSNTHVNVENPHGLLIVIDEYEHTKANEFYLHQIMAYKPSGVRVLVVSTQDLLYVNFDYSGFDYEFMACEPKFTFKVMKTPEKNMLYKYFKPCLNTLQFKIMVQAPPLPSCVYVHYKTMEDEITNEHYIAHLNYLFLMSEDPIVNNVMI